MSKVARRRIAVACQGGGSHAAFAAGVLLEILEPGRFEGIELVGLSGTSGGAVCASLVWSGLVRDGGGPAVASETLASFWRDLSAQDPLDAAVNFWSVSLARLPVTWEISPYAVYAPAEPRMRTLLGQHLVFPKTGALRQPPEIFIGATDVLKGGGLAFDGSVLGIDHIIASAAVPPLFRAVRVSEDELCWDGLFSRNPPIREFTNLESGPPDEIWIVRINPKKIAHEPTLMSEINDRRNELAGNLSLDQEIFFIDKINELRKDIAPLAERYKHIEIREVELALDLDYPSKLDRGVRHIQRLIETGRDAAHHFFEAPPERRMMVKKLIEPARESA
ncbi:MAG: patatin-like phospholipase family protein [Amaricoccus sp.]|uniref:patatin-like phospholipase family protein n=1 Tax=Amaricoccus sp. TaxID=1872485 RepID=UPI0033148344